MRKFLSIAAALCLCTVATFADRAMPGLWSTKTLPDGREVKVELCGDEFAHYWRTADGVKYVERNGVLQLVQAEEIVSMARVKKALAQEGAGARRMRAMAQGQQHAAYVGSKKGLIILVEFSDAKFTMPSPQNYYDRMANEKGFQEGYQKGSVHDYFLEQSGGQFDLTFDVVGPVKMPKSYGYYGQDDANGNTDIHISEMLTTAIDMVDSKVKWRDYDWDGDGEVEQVYYVYAGRGQATGGGANTIWPHKWNLRYALGTGAYVQKQGMLIDTYACSNEVGHTGAVAGIGTICHEFSHCLGLPDTYDITGNNGASNTNYGMGNWDLMCSGNYNGNGYTPAGYTSWEKMMAGWLKPVELTTSTYVTDMRPLSEGGQSYIIYNPAHRNEYYMLENRAKTGWDAGLPGEGMLILYVDYNDKIFNQYNSPNSFINGNDHQRMTIFHADNKDSDNNEQTDTYPFGNLNVLSNYSIPAATLYNKNVDGSKNMNIRVNRISRANDGTMSFVFGDWAEADERVLFAESFDDCSGNGGNDNNWTIFGSGMSTFRPDAEGWASDYIMGGRHCARVGKSAPQAGQSVKATSPSIKFTGDCTLSFRVAPYYKDNTMSLQIATDNPDVKIEQTKVSLTYKEWTEVSLKVTGQGNAKIVFSADSRLYLDDVLVRNNTTSGINDLPASGMDSNQADDYIYDIQGRRVNEANAHGVYVRNGKKMIR